MRIYKTVFILGWALLMTTNTTSGQDNPHNRAPNHLEGAASPYLQQHVYNAVDWYPWGEEALNIARTENKPIFLSIGYSTCHWCHVMEEESFENDQIGDFLNDNFVAIKVDRERRPDLDEQFMLVTQIATGRGGWPNSIFLTNEGEPFYAGTYFPPQQFMDLLQQINGLWSDQRTNVIAEGQRIGDAVRSYMNRTAAAADLTPEAIASAADSLLTGIDPTNGGFGAAPKFPRESTMLFLLDQAERRANPQLLTAVTNALDGMIKGGIHDHVGGGFHRYATDAEWQVPHFEKMLYNQALIGRLLVRTFAATGELRYKRAATRTFDYVIREMRDPEGGFYSAQDADSIGPDGEKSEGPFYIWTPDQISSALTDDADFAIAALNMTSEGNFEGANIPHLLAFPIQNETTFYNRLDSVLENLRAVRLNRPVPHRDEKIVVDWNAMMIVTLAEASATFNRPDYYQVALTAANFITNKMLSDQTLARVSFEGNIGAVAQLSDYAGLGVALLALYDHAPMGSDSNALLDQAVTIANLLTRNFSGNEADQGAYPMTAVPDGLGVFTPLDDSEVPAGNALTLALFDGLAKRTGQTEFSQKATLLAAALSGHALASPQSRAYTLRTAMALSHGEIGSIRYLANGVVKVTNILDRQTQTLTLNLEIAEGWHINANMPLEDYLIPTQLSLSSVPASAHTYPEPLVKSLGFNDQPLALYEGTLQLSTQLPVQSQNDPGHILLKLQACSDELCLAPEEAKFTLW